MRSFFLILSFVSLFLFPACSKNEIQAVLSPGQCMTEDGMAAWTGDCVKGKAQGDGIATYEDNYIVTIAGKMVDGIPDGVVRIDYVRDDYYLGTTRNGHYHGFGLKMRSWGEGFEGNWVEGFRDGKGVYIHDNGRRTPGLWRKDRLIGSWYTDSKTNCKFLWAPDRDPIGKANWIGNCVNGKASGLGTIVWSVSDGGAPTRSNIKFTGKLVEGVIQGAGVWNETDEYTNVIHTKTIEATWQDGEIMGHGRETITSDFIEKSHLERTVRSYEGQFERGKLSGTGQLEETKVYSNGDNAVIVKKGMFLNGMLNGNGKETREVKSQNGDTELRNSEGKFANDHFAGFGRKYTKRVEETDQYIFEATFTADANENGQGRIDYPNGDSFSGTVGSFDRPIRGYCNFRSLNFSGKCHSHSTKTSKNSGTICLVPVGATKNCLMKIGGWIED